MSTSVCGPFHPPFSKRSRRTKSNSRKSTVIHEISAQGPKAMRHHLNTCSFGRAQQWLVMCRQWHLIDAKWQDLDKLASKVAKYLQGRQKPTAHVMSDVGDHVVVVNCADVALKAFDWKRREYEFFRRFPKSRAILPAWEIHKHDPCRLVYMATYSSMPSHPRAQRMLDIERLHLFADARLPHQIADNVGAQMRQVQSVPKPYDEYTEEERGDFPRIVPPAPHGA